VNPPETPKETKSSKPRVMSLVFGGLLPIIAFTVIEEKYGPFYGLIAAMVFGVGELIYEKMKLKKISGITWMGNGLVIGLGIISIFTQDGFWFKMQPAVLEVAFTGILWVTQAMGKPMLVELSKKQNPDLPPAFLEFLKAVNFRCGIFFLIQAGLAVWAALYWTTTQWALLKGVGLTVSFVVYMILEIVVFRLRLNREKH
jgi:intracellular septation protein